MFLIDDEDVALQCKLGFRSQLIFSDRCPTEGLFKKVAYERSIMSNVTIRSTG